MLNASNVPSNQQYLQINFGTRLFTVPGFPGGSAVKNLPAMQETRASSLGQEDPWRRAWQLTPVFLLENPHGQRSLAGLQLSRTQLKQLSMNIYTPALGTFIPLL